MQQYHAPPVNPRNRCNHYHRAHPHPKTNLFEMWSGAGGVKMVRATWLPDKFTTGWRNDDSRVSLLFLNLWKLDRLQVRRGRGKLKDRLRGCIRISGWQGGALHIIGGKLYWRCAAPLFQILLFHFTKSSSRRIISSGQLLSSLKRKNSLILHLVKPSKSKAWSEFLINISQG